MAALSIQDITAAGVQPSYASAAAGGDSFVNDGKTLLHVKNGSASSITVTITRAKTCSFGFSHDVTVTVGAGTDKMIGPFQPEQFNNDAGAVAVGYSAVASVTVAALSL